MLQIKSLKEAADNAYYNSGRPLMTDSEYDALCEQLPDCDVGCQPVGNKATLPVWMGSLNKCSVQKDINSFLVRTPADCFSIQDKLDGVSCLIVVSVTKSGEQSVSLFTRGDGKVGTNITHLFDLGLAKTTIPRTFPPCQQIVVRGELILQKQVFLSKYATGQGFDDESVATFANSRNMVSGLVNRKFPSPGVLCDVEFIAYELIVSPVGGEQMPVNAQIDELQTLGFSTVYTRMLKRDELSIDNLRSMLADRKTHSLFQIDGIVVLSNSPYVRVSDRNPAHAFAFKDKHSDTAVARVAKVVWTITRYKIYQPVVQIDPIVLGGVTISALSGINGRRIAEWKIGEGALILVTRSGDTIPHILKTLSPGAVKLPDRSRWSQNGVDLECSEEHTDCAREVAIRQMVYFCSTLGVQGARFKSMSKLFDGGVTSTEGLLSEPIEAYSVLGEKTGEKLHSSIIQQVTAATDCELMAALDVFGKGIALKKIIIILEFYLSNTATSRIAPKGMSVGVYERMKELVEPGLEKMAEIRALCGVSREPRPRPTPGVREGERGSAECNVYVFSGFRDVALEKKILELGGSVSSTVSNKTTHLITADESKPTAKLTRAAMLGVKIINKQTFLHSLT